MLKGLEPEHVYSRQKQYIARYDVSRDKDGSTERRHCIVLAKLHVEGASRPVCICRAELMCGSSHAHEPYFTCMGR